MANHSLSLAFVAGGCERTLLLSFPSAANFISRRQQVLRVDGRWLVDRCFFWPFCHRWKTDQEIEHNNIMHLWLLSWLLRQLLANINLPLSFLSAFLPFHSSKEHSNKHCLRARSLRATFSSTHFQKAKATFQSEYGYSFVNTTYVITKSLVMLIDIPIISGQSWSRAFSFSLSPLFDRRVIDLRTFIFNVKHNHSFTRTMTSGYYACFRCRF